MVPRRLQVSLPSFIKFQAIQAEPLEHSQLTCDLHSKGCNISQDGSNPMDRKHGGVASDSDPIKYTVSLTQERPPPPSNP
jgi:hypothetical protein